MLRGEGKRASEMGRHVERGGRTSDREACGEGKVKGLVRWDGQAC